jgi:hypothetical protein
MGGYSELFPMLLDLRAHIDEKVLPVWNEQMNHGPDGAAKLYEWVKIREKLEMIFRKLRGEAAERARKPY